MELGSAIKSTSVNIVFQVASRILTFILNAFILRYVSKDALGIMNVRLLLLYSSVQFISREPFRRSCASCINGGKSGDGNEGPSRTRKKSNEWKSIVNLIWFNVPFCFIVCVAFFIVWTRIISIPNVDQFHGYQLSVIIILLSVMIEMGAESLIIYSLSTDNYRLKLRSESVSFIFRCVSISFGAIFLDATNILMVFSASHLLSSILYVSLCWLSYYKYSDENIRTLKDFLPSFGRQNEKSSTGDDRYHLTLSFVSQTIIKQLLTEGEKFVMTLFDPLSFADQGMYEMVNNLASLASRFVLAPIEESAFLIFSKIVDRKDNEDSNLASDAAKDGNQDVRCDKEQKISESKDILTSLSKLMILFGSIILTFGVPFSRLLLLIYAGRSYVEKDTEDAKPCLAPLLLKFQCLYVPIIAINGITECFSFASMNRHQLASFNRFLVFLSLLYLISSFILCNILSVHHLASLGFVIANIINMSVRVSYHLVYISKYFQKMASDEITIIKSFLPSAKVFISSLIILSLLYISDNNLCCRTLKESLIHLLIGVALFLSHIFIIYINEKNLINFLMDQLSKDKQKNQ